MKQSFVHRKPEREKSFSKHTELVMLYSLLRYNLIIIFDSLKYVKMKKYINIFDNRKEKGSKVISCTFTYYDFTNSHALIHNLYDCYAGFRVKSTKGCFVKKGNMFDQLLPAIFQFLGTKRKGFSHNTYIHFSIRYFNRFISNFETSFKFIYRNFIQWVYSIVIGPQIIF